MTWEKNIKRKNTGWLTQFFYLVYYFFSPFSNFNTSNNIHLDIMFPDPSSLAAYLSRTIHTCSMNKSFGFINVVIKDVVKLAFSLSTAHRRSKEITADVKSTPKTISPTPQQQPENTCILVKLLWISDKVFLRSWSVVRFSSENGKRLRTPTVCRYYRK